MTDQTFDIAIIGGGITGVGIAYELSKYDVSVALLEKSSQVTQGSSKGNSGLLHAGYDDPEGSLRARLVTRGNRRYDDWSREIGVGMKRVGSLVVAYDDSGLSYLKNLEKMGADRSVPVEIVDRKILREMEPNINPDAQAALFAPTAGVVCPMRFVNILFKNAVVNGVSPFLQAEVTGFEQNGSESTTIRTVRGDLRAKIVINAAGLFGDVISTYAGIDRYEIVPRKGEYILLEPHRDYNVNHILFPTPTKESKGVLVVPTETGDILLGPTAHNMEKSLKEDVTTSIEGLQEVLRKTKSLVPNLHTDLTVKTYAGNRAQPNTNDFIIERYEEPKNFINAIGIRSPGLTAAPAIADMVLSLVEEIGGALTLKKEFRQVIFQSYDQSERALTDSGWADTITPNLDSPSTSLLETTWQFGVQKELYNFSCFTDRGLGVDLGTTFQNALIAYQRKRGLQWNEVLYRLAGSQQVEPRRQ